MSKVSATLLLAVIVVLLAPARAQAIVVRVPCDAPLVFSDAALNVVVLPYTQADLSDADPGVGQQLAALVELEALLAIAKYRSVGVVQLVGNNCTPQRVLDQLVGKTEGAAALLKPGRAMIVIWGRIFQSGRDLYLQSYLRFLRRDAGETIALPVDGRSLIGHLTSQALACPPRKISLADLGAIQKQFATSNLLRTTPDLRAAFVPIPDEGGPYAFWITEVRGDWVQLQPMANQKPLPRGWVRARSENPQWSLRRRMPELALLEGIGGYLAARVSPVGAQAALDGADAALSQYLEQWKAGALLANDDAAGSGVAMAVAVPEQLRGFVALLRPEVSVAALTAAGGHFARAAALVPFSGDARNLATITRVALTSRQHPGDTSPRPIIDELTAAVSTEPDNRGVLANLGVFYDLVLTPQPGAPMRWFLASREREDVQRQRDALREALQPAAQSRR